MRTLKVLGNCSLVFLAVIGVLVSIAFGYYHFFVDDITVGVNYIDNQIAIDVVSSDDLTESQINEYEERYFLEANFYSNSKNNGIALQELRLNYFTDYTLMSTAYRSTGMQYLGDLKQEDLTLVETTEEQANRDEPSGFSYYDTTNGISWDGNKLRTQLNRESAFTIKIDDRAFQIQLTGTYEWTTYQRQWYTLWIWNKPTTHIWLYNYLDVFADCMQAIRSNSAGFGDYYITVDLSEYFSIKEYDTETGKYKADDVTDIIKNYAVLKFHYDENGARNSSQSIFGCIDCNPSYDVEDKNIDTTYWQERMLYTLTNDDLVYRYSEVYNGYFVSLSMDTKSLFESMPRSKVNIDISMLYNDKNIVGIDYNGFEDFEIDTLSISGSGTFYLLDKSLYDTNLQTIKYSQEITLDFAENSTNSNYVEVIT
jgi:hypothetical protein